MRFRGIVFFVFASLVFLAVPAKAAETRLTVVELYTSQGCSSCPPADAFLGELVKRDDVLGLSFHVDYWDYIGWKDPFAKPAHTQRQRAYARWLNLSYVYTPQMIIQGSDQAVGSEKSKVWGKIVRSRQQAQFPVTIKQEKGGRVTVGIPQSHYRGSADIMLVGFDNRHSTKIRSGENGGRTLSYFNVVRGIQKIGTWTGAAVTLSADVMSLTKGGPDGCAIILQARDTGRIIGAAKLQLVSR